MFFCGQSMTLKNFCRQTGWLKPPNPGSAHRADAFCRPKRAQRQRPDDRLDSDDPEKIINRGGANQPPSASQTAKGPAKSGAGNLNLAKQGPSTVRELCRDRAIWHLTNSRFRPSKNRTQRIGNNKLRPIRWPGLILQRAVCRSINTKKSRLCQNNDYSNILY